MRREIDPIGAIETKDPSGGASPRLSGPLHESSRLARSIRSPAPLALAAPEVGLVFEIGQGGRDVVVKIVDRQSGRVLREIPPEEIQRLRTTMQSILGLVVDQQG
jgi:hypothetical protein